MERNHIIGILLIIAVLFLWNQFFFAPEMEKQQQLKRVQDSIAQTVLESTPSPEPAPRIDTAHASGTPDSLALPSPPQQVEQFAELNNGRLHLRFSNKGGQIRGATLLGFYKSFGHAEGGKLDKEVRLLEDPRNRFAYLVQQNGRVVRTDELYFDMVREDDRSLRFTADLGGGARFIQTYALREDDYTLDYSIKTEGQQGSEPVVLHWENHLDKIERNHEYEKYNSTIYFKEADKDPDYCSCRSDDRIDQANRSLRWISHSHQFFNSSLIAEKGFLGLTNETILLPETDGNLKKLVSELSIPANELAGTGFRMQWYIGPNEYKRLDAFGVDLQYIIPYGWSIFGTVNRYIVRPLFSALAGIVSSYGVVILLMTLIVKLLVFPLGYKMLHSQAKMTALKPEIEKLKLKFKDDQQKQQVETMKLYNEFGVNPLGGCFPLLLQMPVWIALYRFFPATIEFRQHAFLWAADLTSYDEFLHLPFSLPLFGSSLSLFAFLWMVSTLVFTYYSSKSMDFSANPAMKYMQFLMPVIFWFMFNKTAAGLTAYMFFSNLLNIAQTLIGKYYLFDQDKIRVELERNKSKPRKKGGFRDRLETMMQEQQRQQQEKIKKTRK